MFVPESLRLQVLAMCHDSLPAGHFGHAKTMSLVSRQF
ncbi:hypothetical protein AX774_g8016, partial [Zancudomyces culisetae]